MVWVVVIALSAIALGAIALVVGGAVAGVASLLLARHREPSSPIQVAVLAALSVAAVIAVVIIGTVTPGAWFIPGLLWFLAFAVVRNSAPLKETDQQRRVREAAERRQAEEDQKRAAARRAVTERKRVDSFTKDGLALLERGRSAVDGVKATEAARDGWLGAPADLDFSEDLAMISNSLLQARRIEKMVQRSTSIPDPSPDDTAMARDAEKTVGTLRAESKNRVQLLEDCAAQAHEVDRLLAQERRQRELDEQRDDVRQRLAAELYGAEVRPSKRDSDAADAVAARVAAFRELKNVVPT